MSWFRPIALIAMFAALPGCGFSPVYSRANSAGTQDQLAQIRIEPIADRVGQILRNQLLDELTPGGQPRNPRYRLDVELRESIQVLAIRKNEIATRANYNLSAKFALFSLRERKAVLSNNSEVVSSYNILTSDYATVAAENNARAQAARALSGDIRSRLISYFLRANQAATAK